MNKCTKCGENIHYDGDYMQSTDKPEIKFHKLCFLFMKPAEIMQHTGPFGGYELHNDKMDEPVICKSPDCVQGKHHACDRKAWNYLKDEPAECGCECHNS